MDPETLTVLAPEQIPPGPLSWVFFQKLLPGTVLRLYYDNGDSEGSFLWRHLTVTEDCVKGEFRYDHMQDWSSIDEYLCHRGDTVCLGSGPGALHGHPIVPADPQAPLVPLAHPPTVKKPRKSRTMRTAKMTSVQLWLCRHLQPLTTEIYAIFQIQQPTEAQVIERIERAGGDWNAVEDLIVIDDPRPINIVELLGGPDACRHLRRRWADRLLKWIRTGGDGGRSSAQDIAEFLFEGLGTPG